MTKKNIMALQFFFISCTDEPPLLQRQGPPADYMEALNLHQNYQGRAGHLVVPPDPRLGLSNTNHAATNGVTSGYVLTLFTAFY
jgi:hypothetical protein